MALLTLRQIHLSYGDPPLLDGIDLAIERGERICLLGRNGEGKSTLLKVIAAELRPDDGEMALAQGVRLARLAQDVPRAFRGSVFDQVADGLGELAELVKAYHAASVQVAQSGDQAALKRLAAAQHALEAGEGWQFEQRVERVLSRMQLDGSAAFESLSGGMQRRVLLARALASEPDLLLLDEPTNHLDIDAIRWLEEFLLNARGTLVFVTHDRGFLRRLATRIVELDRGKLNDFPGDYDNYLRRRAQLDKAEAQASAHFDKKLAQEEEWIRQGIKARRTRNEGRVRQLKVLREQLRARRDRQGTAKLVLDGAERSGKLVCEASDISYAWHEQAIVRGFTYTILRGDRIGIIGPNGCGKSTLLNLLLGRLQPDTGKVELGTRLQIAYFDQLRAQLEPDKTVMDNVAGGSERVTVNGQSRHVIGYLQDFLFPPARCRQPVEALSGGERNRLLLAKLFTKPANLLVLDEPTNDLDLETLELLEERLLDFDGTLLLVSHDRAFLDNVVTSTLVFEGAGRIAPYVGGYADWLRQRAATSTPAAADAKSRPEAALTKNPAGAASARKMSFKDKRELESLPQRIDALEKQLAEIQQALSDPNLYRDAPGRVAELTAQMAQSEAELEVAFERWEALENQLD